MKGRFPCYALGLATFAIATAAAADPCLPEVTSDLHLHWSQLIHYPAEAWKNGMEGTVEYRVEIDTLGQVTGCTVTKSSGHQLLDDETCAQLFEYGHFNPGLDDDGNPVPRTLESKIVWARDTSPAPKPDKETLRKRQQIIECILRDLPKQ